MSKRKYANKTISSQEALRAHLSERRCNRFRRDFDYFSARNIGCYESKYVAGFAFDGDTARMMLTGVPEKETFDHIFEYLKSKDMVHGAALDIGANYGLLSLYFSEHYKKVFSFEPHPVVYSILKFNVEQNNNGKTIQTYNLGVSSQEDELTLLDHKARNIGGSTFEEKGVKTDTSLIKKYTCRVMPLDGMPELREQKIGFMKIDTEGHEYKVLEGARELIQRDMPVILMEDWSSRNGVESNSIRLLKSLGYANFLVPVKYPQRKTSRNKILNYFYKAQKIATVLTKGETHVLEECDFSSLTGYETIIAFA